jgi:hypothetical protein
MKYANYGAHDSPDCTIGQNLGLPVQSLLYRLRRVQIDGRVELFVHQLCLLHDAFVDTPISLSSNYCKIKTFLYDLMVCNPAVFDIIDYRYRLQIRVIPICASAFKIS